jgi:hypothetical protein
MSCVSKRPPTVALQQRCHLTSVLARSPSWPSMPSPRLQRAATAQPEKIQLPIDEQIFRLGHNLLHSDSTTLALHPYRGSTFPRLHQATGLRCFLPFFYGFCDSTPFFFYTRCNSCLRLPCRTLHDRPRTPGPHAFRGQHHLQAFSPPHSEGYIISTASLTTLLTDFHDDVFYLFLQKQKIGAELHIYLEEGTYHKRLCRGPNTNDMKK